MAAVAVAVDLAVVTPPRILQSNPRRLWRLMAVDLAVDLAVGLVVGLAVVVATPLQIVSPRPASGCSMAIA